MRRVMVFIVVSVFSLLLAGCDLIPQDVQDKISAELCREDPNNELCQLDTLDELEETAALELVNSVFDDVVDDDCNLIADSNPDLQDDCLEKKEELIPMGVTEFKALTIEKDGEFYVVIGDTNKEDLQIKIKVRIVDQESKPMIDFWEITEMMIEGGDVSIATATDFLDKMFIALLDSTVPKDEFCKMYFDEGIDQDCDGMVDEYRRDIQKITINKLEPTDKKYEFRGHVTVLKMSGSTTDVDVDVEVFRQEFGPVQAKRFRLIHEEDSSLIMRAKETFMKMMDDYLDSSISDSDFMMMWKFDHMMSSQYQRMFDIGEVEDVEVLMAEVDEGGAIYVYYRTKFKAGAALSKKVNIAYDDSSGDFSGEFMNVEVDSVLTSSEITSIMDQFIKDYLNMSISDEKFMEMYKGAGMNSMVFNNRVRDRASDIITVNLYSSDNSLKMDVTVDTDGVKSMHTIEVRVNRWESALIIDINDIDNDCDGVCEVVKDRDVATESFQLFIDSFFDIDYSDQMINDMFFGGKMEDSFFSDRREMINNNIMFSILDVVGPTRDGYFIYILGGTEEGRQGEPVKIKITKPIDKATPLLMIFDDDSDDDSIPIDEKMALLTNYKDRFNHMSMLSSNACLNIVPDHRVDECIMERDMRISEGYTIMDIKLMGEGMFEYIQVTYQRPDLLISEWDIFFYYNEDGMLTFELTEHMDMMMYPDPTVLMMMEQSFNDLTIETDEVCMMFTEDSQDECMEIRMFMTTNNFMMKIENTRMEQDMFVIDVVYYNGEEMIGSVTYNNGFETGVDCGGNCLYVDRGDRGVNPLYQEAN